MRYAAKWPEYAKQWDSMVIKPDRVDEFRKLALKLILQKQIYDAIQDGTAHDGLGADGQGVSWYMIAVLHLRESDADFKTYLGNGQALNRRTTIVPKGRGPFLGQNAFYNGAIDALNVDGLSSIIDWRLEKILYQCEIYNGTGYNNKGLPSPYLWGGTNIQKRGKYVPDGVWNSRVMDSQPGCAPILKMMMQLDPTISVIREN